MSWATDADPVAGAIQFNRDIRPILSEYCFQCHGPDARQRKADLRLDNREGAVADRDGAPAIVAGKSDAGSLLERVTSEDDSLRMPPHSTGKRLNAEQVERLRRWIADGAAYQRHWAFEPVKRPALPPAPAGGANWSRNGIDRFVAASLASRGLTPSPEAVRAVLLRRLSLDLLGLPPSISDVDEFVTDTSPDAFDRQVTRLLASPHFGERWGRHWLDQARYADSNGYAPDGERSMWPYRDWVIRALNADMPFDQFTIEQLAGDLLPESAQDQLIATGFHRNTLINTEGGTKSDQFRVEQAKDRADTTGGVWLALTVGCANCHDHKYDPIAQREYYQLYAFFDSTQDQNSTTPVVSLATSAQREQLAKLDLRVAAARQRLAEPDPGLTQRRGEWETNLRLPTPTPPVNAPDDKQPVTKEAAERRELVVIALLPDDKRSKEQTTRLTAAFDKQDSVRAPLLTALSAVEGERREFDRAIPTSMVLRELPQPRETHIQIRGDFLRLGDRVEPNVPAALPGIDAAGRRLTRLDLARWLVRPDHPLTARVYVNRVWMRLFGQGLVETENDFGTQGSLPTHPELLDWLADEFMRQGWSTKRLIATIASSATYRQSSQVRPDLQRVDSRNLWLGRQSRIRVEAEIVRDLGLAASGLLCGKVGGPSVYPPQPDGVYAFTQVTKNWRTSTDHERYRRGMYTFFYRSAPHPMLSTFDVPRFNQSCTRRDRSNTPLQSLTVANDLAMFEITQALAVRVWHETSPGTSDADRLVHLFRLCLSRSPRPDELTFLSQYLAAQRTHFAGRSQEAQELAPKAMPAGQPAVEAAAWTAVARVLLNLDEFITRE